MIVYFLLSIIIPICMTAVISCLFDFLLNNKLSKASKTLVILYSTLFAVPISLYCQVLVKASDFPKYPEPITRIFYEGVIVGPLIEEFLKCLPILFFVYFKEIYCWRSLLLVALLSGIGFYLGESILALFFADIKTSWAQVLIQRTIYSSLSHSFFTGFFGLLVGIAFEKNKFFLKIALVSFGFTLSYFAHALNNIFYVASLDNLSNVVIPMSKNYSTILFLIYFVIFVFSLINSKKSNHKQP